MSIRKKAESIKKTINLKLKGVTILEGHPEFTGPNYSSVMFEKGENILKISLKYSGGDKIPERNYLLEVYEYRPRDKVLCSRPYRINHGSIFDRDPNEEEVKVMKKDWNIALKKYMGIDFKD